MAITLHADFDAGSLDVARSRVRGDTVHLVGRDGHMPGVKPGQWKWLCFEARGVAGLAPRFTISDAFEPGRERLVGHRMVALDLGHRVPSWRPFAHHALDGGTYRFHHDESFRGDRVFVAYTRPMPTRDVDARVQHGLSVGRLAPTPSADTHAVIGRTVAGADELGRSVPALPVYGLRVGNGPGRVVLMSGVHPNESAGGWTLAAALGCLTSDDPATRRLRERVTFDVYPLVNPAGRYAGLNRTTLDAMHRDSNRVWRSDLYAEVPSVRTVAEAVLKDLDGVRPDALIDCHSWCGTDRGAFCYCSAAEGMHDAPLGVALAARGVVLEGSGWSNPSTETWAYQTLGARWCGTLEATHAPDASPGALGRALADALAQAYG